MKNVPFPQVFLGKREVFSKLHWFQGLSPNQRQKAAQHPWNGMEGYRGRWPSLMLFPRPWLPWNLSPWEAQFQDSHHFMNQLLWWKWLSLGPYNSFSWWYASGIETCPNTVNHVQVKIIITKMITALLADGRNKCYSAPLRMSSTTFHFFRSEWLASDT